MSSRAKVGHDCGPLPIVVCAGLRKRSFFREFSVVSVLGGFESTRDQAEEKGALQLTSRTFEPSLSTREHQVLELVASGLSAKEIAGVLGIAPRTVDSHIEHIRLKLGARNRIQMVAQALLRGHIDLESSEANDREEAFVRTKLPSNGTRRPW